MTASDPARKAKDAATKLLAKGKFEAALKELRVALDVEPRDIATRQKIAETLARLNKKAEAVREYQHVVGRYAADGQLLKAVAICKVILQLDPAHTETQKALAGLYAKRRGDDGFTASVPASMAAAMPKNIQSIDVPSDEPGEVMLLVPTNQMTATPPPAPVLEVVEDAEILESVDVIEGVESEVVIELEPAAEISVENEAMPHIPLFSDLGRAAFGAVLDNVEIESFSPGQLIVREGDRDRRMFAIVQGTVSVLRNGPTGEPREVARMNEGDFFGEIALVADSPRLATVAAATPLVLMIFTRERMDEIVRDHPSVGKAVERFYRERLLANVLRSNPLFKPLAKEEKEALTDAFRLRTAPRGAVLLEQGEPPDGFYLLLRGTCEVVDKSGPREKKYPSMGEGSVFGEVSLVLDQPVSATVRAATDVVLLRLARPAFKEHILANDEVRRMVTRLSVERVVRTRKIQAEDPPPQSEFQV